jgi:SAM-dependent methyltransferase
LKTAATFSYSAEIGMSNNTERSFRDKWQQNQHLAFQGTLTEGHEINSWILRRNGFTSHVALRAYLERKPRILDAGCGNGRVTALLRECSSPAHTHIVAIDLVAAEVARKNLSGYRNIEVREGDLLGNLSSLGRFNFIYCQEVLHHTQDPEGAFRNVSSLLEPGGEIAIYVYKRKAPAREYVDDYVRDRIAPLAYEDAIKVSKEITEFGRILSESNCTINVPPVSVLGIEAGEYDLQRFIYHFFMKCFWNPSLSYEDNVAINYDWYHPQLCSRHTFDEVREWFERATLTIVHEFVDFYGITIRGRRD